MKASELTTIPTAKIVELIQQAKDGRAQFVISSKSKDENWMFEYHHYNVLELAQELARRTEIMIETTIPRPTVHVYPVTRAGRGKWALYIGENEIDVFDTPVEAELIKSRIEYGMTVNTHTGEAQTMTREEAVWAIQDLILAIAARIDIETVEGQRLWEIDLLASKALSVLSSDARTMSREDAMKKWGLIPTPAVDMVGQRVYLAGRQVYIPHIPTTAYDIYHDIRFALGIEEEEVIAPERFRLQPQVEGNEIYDGDVFLLDDEIVDLLNSATFTREEAMAKWGLIEKPTIEVRECANGSVLSVNDQHVFQQGDVLANLYARLTAAIGTEEEAQ